MTTLYTFDEFNEDITSLSRENPTSQIDVWWKTLLKTDPTITNVRFTKLMSQLDISDASAAVKGLVDNCLIPPFDKEPEVGFNLYYSDVELTSTSNAAPVFNYYGTWQDYKQVQIKQLPDNAKQFMVVGEDYSYFRASRTIQ